LTIFQAKDFDKLVKALNDIPPMENMVAQTVAKSDVKKQTDAKNPLSYPLLQW
jgi:hypothetical protein